MAVYRAGRVTSTEVGRRLPLQQGLDGEMRGTVGTGHEGGPLVTVEKEPTGLVATAKPAVSQGQKVRVAANLAWHEPRRIAVGVSL